MDAQPSYVTTGTVAEKIDVRLSYKIVRLFSEGLYASPNKAIEELVANSFDAGGHKVAVLLPPSFHDQNATIAIVDDGEGMDTAGLRQHWLIGKSNKRALPTLPAGRQQIGKFGIGKLATYVLANRLTHISKRGGKFYSTSMNYRTVDERGEEDIEPKAPITLGLRQLTEAQARSALEQFTSTQAFKKTGIELFGGKAKSWTFAILSDLKPKVQEIRRGRLEWVLRTALPLRDDFEIWLDGKQLQSSKATKGRIGRWVVGKDIVELRKPASSDLEVRQDESFPRSDEKRYSLNDPQLGRITGYAEGFKDALTGKSDDVGRSHGFFVYVLGRLINVEDGHFGIAPNELRHGTFNRLRVVVHIDALDDFLQSDRERIREGPVLVAAQNLLRSIFNWLRPVLDSDEDQESAGAKLARKLAESPTSLARRPIVEMARAALGGKIRSRYIAVPSNLAAQEKARLIEELEDRARTPQTFVAGLLFVYDATNDDGIATYDVVSGKLLVNALHPFVGAFFDEFTSRTSGLPLEMFAMAEVLLESHLFQAGLKQDQIDGVMQTRDQLLRYVAQETGKRTALVIANALREARNDKDKLEIEIVAAFNSLGFEATRIGGKGKPDGIAKASLSAGSDGRPRRYAVTLEAKSKERDGTKLSTKTLGVSTVARHRDEAQCDHAIVVAPAFDHTAGNESTLAKEIKADRANSAAAGRLRTITAIHVDDLARLVHLRPLKRLDLGTIRELLTSCSLPEECRSWINEVERRTVAKPPYAKIINVIHALQQEFDQAAVEYGALRVALAKETPPYRVATNDELVDLCKAMAALASYEVTATDRTVELNQSPANVIAAIESAMREHLEEEN